MAKARVCIEVGRGSTPFSMRLIETPDRNVSMQNGAPALVRNWYAQKSSRLKVAKIKASDKWLPNPSSETH